MKKADLHNEALTVGQLHSWIGESALPIASHSLSPTLQRFLLEDGKEWPRATSHSKIIWRDLLNNELGALYQRDYLAPETIAEAGVFRPLRASFLRGLWQILPRSSSLFGRIDAAVGLVLTTGILARIQNDPRQDFAYRPRRALSDWQNFVLRHSKPGNLIFHFVSMLMFFGSPIVALFTKNPLWLLAFFLSGIVGTLGHAIFRDGAVSVKEATIQLTVPLFVLRMFALIVSGRYGDEIKKTRTALACNPGPVEL